MERLKKCVVDTDRLSDLPDHVLLHIIEFMNIKQSVQTCVLSKRWKDLWKHLTNLKLHHSYPDNSDLFFNFVSQILCGRNDSIPLHSLDFEHEDRVDPPKATVLEVMRYAASHNVQLQQLTVYARDDAQALCISNSKVSSLTIGSNYVYDEAHNYKVMLCTPKLTSLTAKGRPTFEAPSAHNLPFLEEVKIDYTYYYEPCEDSIMISWLQLLANVTIMTLSFKTLVQIIWVLKNNGSMGAQPPCFVRLKSLKVELKSEDNISNGKVRKIVKKKLLFQNSPPARVDIIRKA